MSSDRTERTDPEPGTESGGGSLRELLVRVAIGAVLGPILMLAVLTIIDSGDEGGDVEPVLGAEPFRVENGQILSPSGKRFVVKGVTIPYGTFAGGDENGLGARNYDTAAADFKRLRRLGVNTVRVLVTPRSGDRRRLRRLHRIVRLARRRGFVVLLGPAFTSHAAAERLLRELAPRYGRDPWVWFLTRKDPNCSGRAFVARCLDWALWQGQQKHLIRILRSRGVRSPVVVNTPDYSDNLSRIDRYPLADENLVWGVHRYATTDRPFSEEGLKEERRDWAGRSLDRPVIVDEVGGAGPGLGPFPPWLGGFLDFLADWTRTRNGSGAIAFVWRWSDANTMTEANGRLTPWGEVFVRRYLARDSSRL